MRGCQRVIEAWRDGFYSEEAFGKAMVSFKEAGVIPQDQDPFERQLDKGYWVLKETLSGRYPKGALFNPQSPDREKIKEIFILAFFR